jgi:dipeptidyl aminopeptidase/acylaminoacyl peptidase
MNHKSIHSSSHTKTAALLILLVTAGILQAQAPTEAESGFLSGEHLFELRDVSDPQISPEGDWIAYTVARQDLEEDNWKGQVWVVPATGGEPVPMTAEEQWTAYPPQPRWSPDGKYLAFLSTRKGGKHQVWSLFRQGGDAVQLTDTAQSVRSFEWSPDSGRMLLMLKDPTPQELAAKEQGEDYKEEKTAPPWVIDRRQFKTDYVGYLDRRRTHIHVLDLASKKISQLTSGDYDDSQATWSPDGSRIAFTSNRTDDPDSNYNTDIWTVSSDPENAAAGLTRVSTSPGPDESPAWSPDGKLIAHTSVTDTSAMLYATSHLAVSSAKGGNSRVLTGDVDRMIFSPQFSPDGRHIWFLLEDSGEQNLTRISPRGGKIHRLIRGEKVVRAFNFGSGAHVAALISLPQLPPEIFQFHKGKVEQRTFENDEFLSGLQLGDVEKIRFKSKDGTEIEAFVIKPPGFVEGQPYPTILDIHGGPQSQYDYAFQFEGQHYAANGYLVIHPNPRGSTGYGQDFCMAIWQDWGGPDFEDVMASVDAVIERGWADPDRLGVTGWSYGGILTNHVITKTDRFKAAATGASETLYVVNYGHDMYQRWWEQELGLPWEPEARERYEKISPFNRIDQVVTPTLILGGEKDWNVPIINSEQLYLALKRLGVETELVVYPGEFHGNFAPSHSKDLYQRYLDWFGGHLQTQ